MTPRDIGLRRLRSQHLIGSGFARPEQVVRWLVAVQAQDFAGAKWSLGLRMRGATDGAVERAFDRGALLRTHVMRPTWHFVTPDDIRWLLMLTGPRIHSVNAHRYRQLSLDASVLRRSVVALGKAVEGGRYRTRDELREVLRRSRISTDADQRMAYLLMFAELEAVICSGPRRGRQFTYALLDDRAPSARALDRFDALTELARRYFASRGPATVQDFARWSGLTVADARNGLEAVKRGLEHDVVAGREMWFREAGRRARSRSPAAQLLSVYDEYISGYKDRSAIATREVAKKLLRMGNALLYVVAVDGRIVGTWKRDVRRNAVDVATRLLASVTRDQRRAIVDAARRYGAFIALPVRLV